MHLHCDSRRQRCCTVPRYVPNDPIPIRRCLERRDERDSASERAQDIELIKNCNYRANLEARIISAVM